MDNKKELETNKEDFLSFLGSTTEHKKVITKEDVATKENFMPSAGGITEHKTVITKEGEDYVQYDYLTTRIRLNALTDKAVALLNYWCVESFDGGFIDWTNREIILLYRTEHYVPKAHAMEILKGPTALTSLEEV